MNLTYSKAGLALGWVLIIVAIAAGRATSIAGWALLGLVALLPPVVVLRMWNEAPQTVSESIKSIIR